MAHYLFNFARKGAAKGRTLREQASELLQVALWGIGERTPNRSALSAGDRALIYDGAPEYAFIGHAELASGTRPWTPEEASRYPGSMPAGVTLVDASVWDHPIPIKTVLPQLDMTRTNPGAHFFSGVVRITEADYDVVTRMATGQAATSPSVQAAGRPAMPSPPTPAEEHRVDIDLLFRAAEKLKKVGSASLSEYDTRAEFIDRYLEALGYTEFGDIQRGSPVDSGDFPDYVLLIGGKRAIAIEAKKLGSPLGPKEAGQVVKYCANLGVRWGVVTDGQHVKLYDAPVLGVSPEDRLIFSINLADYRDREDFETRIYPELELIAKAELESGAGLERRVALEAVRELLTSSGSSTAKALRRELRDTKRIDLSASALSELVSELLG